MEALRTYLKAEHGRARRLAEALGINESAVSMWLRSQVPAERVVAVEKATGIPRCELRPDIFGVAPKKRRVT